MATRINGSSNLLNSNIGLDQVLERPTTQSHLPKNMSYLAEDGEENNDTPSGGAVEEQP